MTPRRWLLALMSPGPTRSPIPATQLLDDVSVDDIGGPDGDVGSALAVDPPAGFDGSLAPGESVTFTATGTAIDDLYHNVATTTGTPVDAGGAVIPGVENPTAEDESWYAGTDTHTHTHNDSDSHANYDADSQPHRPTHGHSHARPDGSAHG